MIRNCARMENTFFKVTEIDVFYRDVRVLYSVSLHVDKGEIASVIGPNGAGKRHLAQDHHGFRASGQGLHNLPGSGH